MSQPRADYDSPWKEIIESFFPQFMAFFFPAIAAEIDWRQPHIFLDKEFQETVRAATSGRHIVDKLVRVQLITGDDVWLLIHIEVQSQVDAEFAHRMFVSNYRVFNLYTMEVVSLGILADEKRDWRPTEYGYGRWGSEMRLRFPIVKLLDYTDRWEELAANPNLFAIVVMAHVKAQATRRKTKDRLSWKINLVKLLYERGYERREVLELFRFIDWVMALPPALELSFREEIRSFEEGGNMRYVTSIERLALKEGREEGREEGSLDTARENILAVLNLRCKTVPQELVEAVNSQNDLTYLKKLLTNAVTVGSIEEFERDMDAAVGQSNK